MAQPLETDGNGEAFLETPVFKILNVTLLLWQALLGMLFTTFTLGPLFDGWLLTLAKEQHYPQPNTLVGSVESVRGVTALLVAVPTGMLTDKFATSRAWLLKMNCILLMAGIVMLCLAILNDAVGFLYGSVAVIATYNQMRTVCTNTLLADSVPQKHLVEVTSALSSISLVGASLGPLLQCLLLLFLGDVWDPVKLRGSLCAGFLLGIPLLAVSVALQDPQIASRAANQEEAVVRACYESRVCGVKRKWIVPGILQFAGVIYGMGAGMTVRFFPLFFKEDYGFSPLWVNLIIAMSRIFTAGFVQLCKRMTERVGRMQAALMYDFCGILCLLLFAQLQNPWLSVICFLFRTAFSNASFPIEQAIIFECVASKHRGKLSAIQSIFSITWSGSAAFGGWLADSHDYRFTFLFTALLYSIGLTIDLPVLAMVPRYAQ
eukprot:TRINITY_DN12355_c0_g3_i1.p1 TRINITY_DN12355_c0_g3~~TRINITY_DN12355_c0_g3_i1.p1  ORF type:complete len:433 (-),score=52.79 TRINITY_DN12355_c0_g3_i1:536-1834(-)